MDNDVCNALYLHRTRDLIPQVIPKSLSPVWNEQFDLHSYSDQSSLLEVSVFDKDSHGKDDYMGKFTVDLDSLTKEETHTVNKKLEEGSGSITLVITVSGTLGSHAASDLLHYHEDKEEQKAIGIRYVSTFSCSFFIS
jgi:Ca2+-dependent lipid-binding protein